MDVLYEKAKAGVSDLSDSEMKNILENVEIQVTNNKSKNLSKLNTLIDTLEPNVETYTTAEILESNDDNQVIAVTAFSDVYLNESELSDLPLNNNISPLWSGDIMDRTYSVRAYATLNVEASTVNGVAVLRLKGATGGWSIEDSRVKSITNRYVTLGNGGLGSKGEVVNQSFGPYFLASNSFNKPITTSYVVPDLDYNIGVTTTATLSSSMNSWDMKMVLRFPEEASDS